MKLVSGASRGRSNVKGRTSKVPRLLTFDIRHSTFDPLLFGQDDLRANEADCSCPHRGDLAQCDDLLSGTEQRDPVALLRSNPARGDRLALADLPRFERRELETLEGEVDLRQRDGVGRPQALLRR